MKHRNRYAALITLAAATTLIAACNKPESETVGQKLDGAVSGVESAAKDMKAATTQTTEALAAGTGDVLVTAKVNAALAADPALSALAINVDTERGRVVLKGTAPDEAARARATALVAAVEGVQAVDNRLTVEKRS